MTEAILVLVVCSSRTRLGVRRVLCDVQHNSVVICDGVKENSLAIRIAIGCSIKRRNCRPSHQFPIVNHNSLVSLVNQEKQGTSFQGSNNPKNVVFCARRTYCEAPY